MLPQTKTIIRLALELDGSLTGDQRKAAIRSIANAADGRSSTARYRITLTEACDQLSISKSTFWRRVLRGVGQYATLRLIREGRDVFVFEDEIQKMMEES